MPDPHLHTTVSRGKSLKSRTWHFLQMEAAGGIILVIASALALLIANSALFPYYDDVLNKIYIPLGFSDIWGYDLQIKNTVLHWINDGFMALFFFLVGLEIKREFVEGELSSRTRALLPALAAIGGMAVPALIFWYINQDDPETIHGWAIPAATDIAFSLGVLALLGSRAPLTLKILLTAIAVIDDLGAILIIALFYAQEISLQPLMAAAFALLGLLLLNLCKVTRTAPYLVIGALLWFAVLHSGIHATLAGVLTALFIPVKLRSRHGTSPAKRLEHALHPWIAFGVLPLFGFANAGVPFAGMGLSNLLDPVTLGIILGLFIGKQLGIFGAIYLAIKSGLAPMPKDANWLQLYGISLLCGIGFTMSLFIGGLAYTGTELQAEVRMGVLAGSLLSAACGYAILRYGAARAPLS